MTEEEFEKRRLAFFAANGMEMRSRRVEDREGRTLYAMENSSEGEPVIVIHGGGAEGSIWAPLLPALPEGRRWIIVDRPGHGLSYKLDYTGVPYRQAAVDYVSDLLDGLGLERASFLGNSMGGYFSLCFALAHPERLDRLLLLGAPAGVDRWIPLFLRLMGLRWFNRLLFAMMSNPTPEVLRRKLWGPLLVADENRVPNEMLEIGIAASAFAGAETAWRTLLESFLTLRGCRQRYYIRDEVSSLAIPTTFVWGNRDAFAPPTSGEELARRMPDATLVKLEGAGHLPWLDAPEACAAAVERALALDTTGQTGST